MHWPLLQLTQAAVGFQNPLPLWATTGLITLAFPLAWLLFEYVEQPARTARSFVKARSRKSLWVAAAASIACVGLASGGAYLVNLKPLYVDEDAPAFEATSPPNPTPYVPRNMTPTLAEAVSQRPNGVVDGCHASSKATSSRGCVYGHSTASLIALFGDSHALQWLPGLRDAAATLGRGVILYTKDSCPPARTTRYRDGVAYWECDVWREEAIAAIRGNPAIDLVVVSTQTVQWARDSEVSEDWPTALQDSLADLRHPTVVLADTPTFPASVPVCLSQNLSTPSKCGKPPGTVLARHEAERERAAAVAAGAGYVSMERYLCSAGACDPVLGATLVYRDAHHLTAEVSALLSGALASELRGFLEAER